MDKIFYNENGEVYYILFGGKGTRTFLCNVADNGSAPFVVCKILEDNSWWHGSYFETFDDAYKFWKEE